MLPTRHIKSLQLYKYQHISDRYARSSMTELNKSAHKLVSESLWSAKMLSTKKSAPGIGQASVASLRTLFLNMFYRKLSG